MSDRKPLGYIPDSTGSAPTVAFDDPHEMAVVSAFVNAPDEFKALHSDVGPELFVSARAKALFLAALDVDSRGALNPNTLLEKLRQWNTLEDVGGIDTVSSLTRHEEDNAFTVDSILRNFPPVELFVVRWNFPLMERDSSLDPTALKKPGGAPKKFTEDDLLDILGKDSLTMKDWQARAAQPENGKIASATFFRLSQGLKKARRVKTSPLEPRNWFAA